MTWLAAYASCIHLATFLHAGRNPPRDEEARLGLENKQI
jgi:hypothetical protein